ncbi:MAG: TraR/DksA family transcriptional regulator [Hafnia sp.]
MADAADMAQEYTDALIERGVRIVQAHFTAVSLTHCEACDEVIPPRRRELIPGVTTCVTCQSRRELLEKVGVPLSGGFE